VLCYRTIFDSYSTRNQKKTHGAEKRYKEALDESNFNFALSQRKSTKTQGHKFIQQKQVISADVLIEKAERNHV
jgi:hypothetical protein